MPIDIENQTAALRTKYGISFRDDPDPIFDDISFFDIHDYYANRESDPRTNKPVADHIMTHTLISS